MENATSPLLTKTDWAQEWKDLQALRGRSDSAEYWNERAKNFGCNDKRSDYAASFLELLELEPGESVLDMGCGNGALTLPLAEAGHTVLACDFSTGMLDRLHADLPSQHAPLVTTKLLSWDDDWEAAGLTEGCVDVAFASRSIATGDLRAALDKLSWAAKRRVCITLSTGHSPRTDENIMRALGLAGMMGRDYWYAINILIQAGITPEVRYIRSKRWDVYESPEAALENLSLMVKSLESVIGATEVAAALERLRVWAGEELHEVEGGWALRQPREVCWAFISWDL